MSTEHNPVQDVLTLARSAIIGLNGRTLDVLDVKRPPDLEYARHLARVVSKLSPLVGNMLEFFLVSYLNEIIWPGNGKWERQDPGFPDTIFNGPITPKPGIEVKTWFPLATEITARFKDSILRFQQNETDVAVIAWLPEHILYGKPQVINIWIDSAKSLAQARDQHYHNPPNYLVFEPEDTSNRTANLQQTNTNGYIFQGTKQELEEARRLVDSWGTDARVYSPLPEYQKKLRELLARYNYRMETNFAKIDRIRHAGLEEFKTLVLGHTIDGYTIEEWSYRLLDDDSLRMLLEIEPPQGNMIS